MPMNGHLKAFDVSRLIPGVVMAVCFAAAAYADDGKVEFEIDKQSAKHAVSADTEFEVISRETEKKLIDERKTPPDEDQNFVIVRSRTPRKKGDRKVKCIKLKPESAKNLVEEIRGEDGRTFVIIR